MAETQKPRKCPTGTVRHWANEQTVIKAHDNSIYDAGWMNLPTMPSYLVEQLRELDQLGKEIGKVKDPVDGILWLDKEINDFEPSSGSSYTPADFKQYSGWYGIEGYSFTSEFSKRYSADKIQLNSQINDAILEANEAKGRREGKNYDVLLLTKEEIKVIRDRIRYDFKYTGKVFDSNDIGELKTILKKVNKYLQQGENFEDEEQKRIYLKNREKRNHFADEYSRLKIKRQEKDEMLEEIDNTFQDNWGIRESFRKQMEKTYQDYISKYIDQIKIDEVKDFEEKIQCPINAPIEKFYDAVNSAEGIYTHVNVEDYIGKKIPSSYSKYDEVTLVRVDILKYPPGRKRPIIRDEDGDETSYSYSSTAYEDLKKKLQSRESTDLGLIFQLRFNELYKKDLEGDWDIESIDSLHILEKIIHYLPKGHCLTNHHFRKLQKDNNYSDSTSYAHYMSGEDAIFLSSKALSETDMFSGGLHDGNEFVAVLIHEIGHAVSDKFSRAYKTKYRDFSRACGWGWDYLDKKDPNSYSATGDAKDIKKTGVNSNIDLISDYASKSPEEAFAEYYSFYAQYKDNINKFLDHNDTSGLGEHKEHLTNPKFGETISVGDIMKTRLDGQVRLNIDKELFSQYRDIAKNIKLDFVSPWEVKHTSIHEETMDKKQLRNYIDFVKEKDIKPLVCITKNNGQRQLIGDEAEGYLNIANKIANKPTPVCSISEEIYNNLKNKGYSNEDIISYSFDSIKDSKYPLTKDTEWETKTVSGLRFGRDGVVPKEKLIKNKEIFQKMRTIFYSEELKKALEGLKIL